MSLLNNNILIIIGSLSIAVELPRDVLVAVNSVTSTTISLSVSISNYDSNIPYTITVSWINPCSDETDISDHYTKEYIPTMEYNIIKNYADYNITVTIINAAGSITSDVVSVTLMKTGKYTNYNNSHAL